MKTIHSILRERLLARAGLLEFPPPKYTAAMIDFLRAHKWSPKFEELMRNRLLMGALRYATPKAALTPGFGNGDGRPTKVQTRDMIKRLRKYEQDGNLEHLVDVANLAMIEFETTDHPQAHLDLDKGCDRLLPHEQL